MAGLRRQFLFSFSVMMLIFGCSSTNDQENSQTSAETIASAESSVETGAAKEPEATTEAVAEVIPEPPEPEEDVYTGISAAIALGDPEEAIDKFESAFSEDPEDVETKILYAGLLLSAGELDEAKKVLLELLEIDPEIADALFTLSLVEGILGNEDEQIALLERLIEHHTDDYRGHASLGEIYLKNRKNELAREAFLRSLELDPFNAVALVGYGTVLLRQEEPRQAEQIFSRVIEESPDYSFAYVDRSRALSELGDYGLAERDLSKAIELEPDFSWHYIDRGRIRLLALSDPLGALEDFSRAIELDPGHFYPYAYRAGILDRLDERDRAISDYMTVIEARPDYYYVHAPLAILLFLSERWAEARTQFALAFDADDEEYGYPLMIALAYKKEGRDRDATQFLREAIGGFPRDSLYYHAARLFAEPGYEGYMVSLVNREPDSYLKKRILYYVAAHYLLEGRDSLAHKFLLEVADDAPPGMYEARIASWELDKVR